MLSQITITFVLVALTTLHVRDTTREDGSKSVLVPHSKVVHLFMR